MLVSAHVLQPVQPHHIAFEAEEAAGNGRVMANLKRLDATLGYTDPVGHYSLQPADWPACVSNLHRLLLTKVLRSS